MRSKTKKMMWFGIAVFFGIVLVKLAGGVREVPALIKGAFSKSEG